MAREEAIEQEPTTKNDPIDYYRAFKIACELLNGSILYGIDADRIYEIMMAKDGVVSSNSYESYILNNLQELDKGQYVSEPTTKNDLGVEKVEVRKPCINYEDGCEEWAGCPCVHFKARK